MIPMLRNCSLGPSGVLVREDWSSTASLASSADTTLITAAKSAMTTNIVLAPETIWPRRVVRTREGTREVEQTLLTPRRSSDEARDALQRVAQDVLCGTRCWQMNPDHRLHFDDARGEFDEPQAQRVELRYAPYRTLGHRDA